MITAYAATTTGGTFEPISFDPGPLASHDVEIAVQHCGICHSDLSMWQNEWGMSRYPLVPGHEVVGTVSALGAQVTHLKIGQAVGLGWQAGYCMTCSTCMGGDHNLCDQAQGTIIGRHGGFADKVRAQAASVIALPEGLDMASAGPLLCAGITVFNPLVQFDIKPTDKVAVIGIGGLGHLALQFVRAWGCEVTAFSSSQSKAQEARDLGAHHVIDSRDPKALKAVAGQFDLILSTVNVKLDWNSYIGALKPKGRLHLVGATLEPLQLNVFPMLMKQRSVSASPVGSPQVMADMLAFAAQHGIRAQTEHFAFEQVNEAMARVESGHARYRVVLSRD
ncbi:NADPH-dependent aldehyde reductase Ahr [Atopomonas sediminilitoris]|uniref:NADPH-dependent aldehyde reductase Ahr n=1 Tax=Atopomonas sediminilitoris TaxID=2919919 RepID=UPI001F4DBD19|nr:NAD(P)-dependent alcohol dehydrogenase [Atopomonas sediminilitoris]MCJ8167883.1 NAD(P)-dependent alcohol dehydrogenase [Atopomonas sediminilitoris]